MKKLICMAITITILLSLMASAYSDLKKVNSIQGSSLDLSTYSDTELVKLLTSIKKEIVSRSHISVDDYLLIAAGKYYSDKDISTGTYEIVPVTKETYWELRLKQEDGTYKLDYNEHIDVGKSFRFTLPENSYIELREEVLIKKAEKIF